MAIFRASAVYLLAALLTAAGLTDVCRAARGAIGEVEILKLGRVSAHPRRHYEQLDRLGEYMAQRLGEHGITGHQVVIPRDNAEMIEFLRAGKIDLVSESPFSALLFEELADAEIILREWKQGVPTQRALFVTRIGTGVESLDDLAGRTVAFEDPGSTTSYFLPSLALQRRGLRLAPYSELKTSPETVRYSFAGTDLNILYWLARGRVDAGVVSDLDWSSQRRAPEGLTRQLKVFHLSEPTIRSLVLVRPGLDPSLRRAILICLTSMANHRQGRNVLDRYFGTERFDAIAGEVTTELQRMRRLYQEFGGRE